MITNRLGKLEGRRTDPALQTQRLYEAYARIQEDEAVRYAIGAMQPIDPAYTKTSFEQGDRVKNQLRKGLEGTPDVASYEYQGSVTSDTHIKAHSDIDLLTLHDAFISIEPPTKPNPPYQGDPLEDLTRLRRRSVSILRAAFPEVDVDSSPGKSIRLSGGSLQRNVDVVVGNWWDTSDYASGGLEYLRGVKILDTKTNQRIGNKPFLHNKRIDERDGQFRGNLRKTIRLLKSLKYDADSEVRVSSYDVAALAYSMPDSFLNVANGFDLKLVDNARIWLGYIQTNEAVRSSLMVPNRTRPIFGAEGATLAGLTELHREVADLVNDINKGLARSFKKLEEARIAY